MWFSKVTKIFVKFFNKESMLLSWSVTYYDVKSPPSKPLFMSNTSYKLKILFLTDYWVLTEHQIFPICIAFYHSFTISNLYRKLKSINSIGGYHFGIESTSTIYFYKRNIKRNQIWNEIDFIKWKNFLLNVTTPTFSLI